MTQKPSEEKETTTKTEPKPDWAWEAKIDPQKPEWQDKIPRLLWDLGRVFFPIPGGRKGWDWRHDIEEQRYLPDSEMLNAYFDAGYGYGISCASDTVVVDIDEKDLAPSVTEKLPETAYQITGSREGIHLFYKCPGLNTRQTLHRLTTHDCSEEEHKCNDFGDNACDKHFEWVHLGEVKADPHGYVIGPGSLHPSGNTYGPLKGDEIAEVEKEELLSLLSSFIKSEGGGESYNKRKYESGDNFSTESKYAFYGLDVDDVFPWLGAGERIAHPVHGSSTGTNFMKNEDGETFTCWRHNFGGGQGCGLNPQQLLAQIGESNYGPGQCSNCGTLRRKWTNDHTLHYYGWREALEKGLISNDEIPRRVLLGYAELEGWEIEDDEMNYGEYWQAYNALKYETDGEIIELPEGPT